MTEAKLKKIVPLLFVVFVLIASVFCIMIYKASIENQLTRSVKNSLSKSSFTNPDEISVVFSGRNAQLSGFVSSRKESEQIISYVEGIEGVKLVDGDFKLKPAKKVSIPATPPAPKKVETKIIIAKSPEPKPTPAINYEAIRNDITINKIYFQTNRSTIPTKSLKNIQNVAEILKKNQQIKITIVGVADRRGNRKKNQKLSLRRALAVKNKLLKLGVNDDQLTLEPLGESTGSRLSRKDLWKNRRVEFRFVKPVSH